MAIQLYNYQREALDRMKNGCILCGGVGSGKSRTGLAYYYLQEGGQLGTDDYIPMKNPRDLYIITTARKRDTCEWQGDLAPFLISPTPEANYYKNKVVIDSWNNITKYVDVKNAFFIFDEQRVVAMEPGPRHSSKSSNPMTGYCCRPRLATPGRIIFQSSLPMGSIAIRPTLWISM